MKRIVIIGLDGVPFDLIDNLSQKKVLKNLPEIFKNGNFIKINSTVPEISSIAWSSAITGKNAAEHGIFGFIDLLPNSYGIRFPNYLNLKEKPFWDRIDGKSIIINVPSTYPVREMKGIHISGFVSIDMNKSVYPKELVSILNDFDYKLDVNTEYGHKSYDLFFKDLDDTLNARIETAGYLWNKYTDWEIFMLVFTGTDRLMHFLWQAYEDENNKYHSEFLKHFEKIDKFIGEIADKLETDDGLIMLSDHGFEKLDIDFYVNKFLMENGLLKMEKEGSPYLRDLSDDSVAFSLDPARIYINSRERFPKGKVKEKDKDKIIEDIIDLFKNAEYNGKKLTKYIFKREDIYYGKYLKDAPDIVLIGNEGINLKGNIKAEKIFKESYFTGKHSYDNAFCFLSNGFDKSLFSDYNDVRILANAVLKYKNGQ